MHLQQHLLGDAAPDLILERCVMPQSIAGSQLGRMLAGGTSGGGRGSRGSRRLSAGEVQRQLNAIGGSRVQLEPDLLRHVSV